MDCKNCTNSLQSDYSFCPECGAKVIRNRLTIKNLFQDLTERYFNIDNTFLRTYIHLFTKPEIVIDGYITGIRKKYVNPISYFTIALMLAGLLIFFMRNVFHFDFDVSVYQNQGMSPELAKKMMDFSYDYSSIFFISYIPILVLAGIITLNKRKYILAEYTISTIYCMAQWSITSFFSSMLVVCFWPDFYMGSSMIVLGLLVLYYIYVQQRIHKYSFTKLVYKSVLYAFLVGVLFIILIFIIMILGFVTGFFNVADFAPPQ